MKYFLSLLLVLVCTISMAQEGRYTFVFLNTNPDRAELPKAQVDSLQAGHMANIGRLVGEQKMIAAGPFYTGGGIFLFDTDLWNTEAVLSTDPAIAAGRFKLEVIPFNMDIGAVCPLWDKAEEDISMTMYFIMRFNNPLNSEASIGSQTSLHTLAKLSEAQETFEELTIHADINFDRNKGQVVIFEGEESKMAEYEAFFQKHELVKNGTLNFYLRKLYFPKGVFCED